MPRISDATRRKRREHIMHSAWGCFAVDGFQATSMDDVIAAAGMSSSAVYRYFRSKEEIIDATAEEGLRRLRDSFTTMLAEEPTPTPARALTFVIDRLRELAAEPRQDMTRMAMQTWAEALRRPALHEHTRLRYVEIVDALAELASRWLEDGYLAPGCDPRATAATFFTLVQGMFVCHHLIGDLQPADLLHGLAALGGAGAATPTSRAVSGPPVLLDAVATR